MATALIYRTALAQKPKLDIRDRLWKWQ